VGFAHGWLGLARHHTLTVSRETLRKWMIESGIWLSRKQRRSFHQPRLRREAFGELIQIDGSEHRWFEDRGDACTLLVFIDDATGRLMQLQFVSSESTVSYFEALRSYLENARMPGRLLLGQAYGVSHRQARRQGWSGHETVGLVDPNMALDTIEAAGLAPLLITAVTFPAGKPNGISLARMAKLKRPDIKAVIVGALEHQSLAEGLGDFLAMPFDPQALVDVVDRLLDRVPTCC
jgi:hypothetical protein